MTDPLELITEGCWLALRFGMCISSVPTGNLRIEGGVYRWVVGKLTTRSKRPW